MPLTIGAWKKSVRGIERFVDEHICVTEYLPNLNMDDVERYGVEAIVVGSDQIWRPVMYDAVKYVLGFVVFEGWFFSHKGNTLRQMKR